MLVPLTLVLAVLLVGVTGYGLFSADPYRLGDSVNAQGRGQDLVTLVAAPALVACAVRACLGSLRAYLLWLGVLFYIVYSYVTYAFSVPFNDAFLGYVAVLGIAAYLLFTGLMRVEVPVAARALVAGPRRVTAWFFLFVGPAFALVWLKDILPAIPGGVPSQTFAYDLPNPIYVLDLGFVIPLIIGTAVLLLRSRPAGSVLGAILLAKVLTLGLALLAMGGFQIGGGYGLSDKEVPVVVLAAILVVMSATLLVIGARRFVPPTARWRRRTVWPSVAERDEEAVPVE
jgi:hypothetical protein